jgi:hypothetical protein
VPIRWTLCLKSYLWPETLANLLLPHMVWKDVVIGDPSLPPHAFHPVLFRNLEYQTTQGKHLRTITTKCTHAYTATITK